MYFPPFALGTMIAAAVGNDRYLLLTSNDDPDASFVGIVGSMGRMERDDANDDDNNAASYVYESRNVDAVVGGGGGMRRNAPGAREERTGGDEEEKGREGRDGTSDVGRATTTTTKRRGLVAVSRHNNQIKVAWVRAGVSQSVCCGDG